MFVVRVDGGAHSPQSDWTVSRSSKPRLRVPTGAAAVAAAVISAGVVSCGDDPVSVAGSGQATSGNGTVSGGISTSGVEESGVEESGVEDDANDSSSSSSSGNDADSSSTGPTSAGECGDGVLDDGEACDDGNRSDFDGCSAQCEPELCGDGVTQPPEACDLGPDNGDASLCRSDCTEAECGDGALAPNEGCDDGNTLDFDGCSASCELESCGDGVVGAGEECDDGNRSDDDTCTTQCRVPLCGDGLVSPSIGEDCDDANADNTDRCPSDCTLAACGDADVESAEECDDGGDNGNGSSSCTSDCTLNACGDGYWLETAEECDDGAVNGDGLSACREDCRVNICGDAYVHQPTEDCDAGDGNGYVPCTPTCADASPVVELSVTVYSSCGLRADGSVTCWGQSSYLGVGFWGNNIGDEPDEVPGAEVVVGAAAAEIEASGWFSCLRSVDHSVQCWGQNSSGGIGLATADFETIGDDPSEVPLAPVLLANGGASISEIETSLEGACAISESNLYCWGTNWDGGLGYGNQELLWGAPSNSVELDVGVDGIAVGVGHACVLSDGTVRCFGRNDYGQLGLGHADPIEYAGPTLDPQPEAVELGGVVTKIEAGILHTCALLETGRVKCWGFGTYLGHEALDHIGDDAGEMPPADLNLGDQLVVDFDGDGTQHCAILTDGTVRCWGGWFSTPGYPGVDGIGNAPGEMPPPILPLPEPAVSVAVGELHSCALLNTGAVRCWGDNEFGQLGLGHADDIGDDVGEMPPDRVRLYLD